MTCATCGHPRTLHGRRGAGACRHGRRSTLALDLGAEDTSCTCLRFRASNQPKRHRWGKTDTCQDCGLRREGYGGGRCGAMRYWRGSDRSDVAYRPGPCPGKPPEPGHVGPIPCLITTERRAQVFAAIGHLFRTEGFPDSIIYGWPPVERTDEQLAEAQRLAAIGDRWWERAYALGWDGQWFWPEDREQEDPASAERRVC